MYKEKTTKGYGDISSVIRGKQKTAGGFMWGEK